MKSINVTSIILFLAIILFTVFIGGKEINSKIEEIIHNNYQSEIESLKEKINKQTELINSIINLNNKNEQLDSVDKNDDSQDTSSSNQNENTSNKSDANDTGVDIALNDFLFYEEDGEIVITKYIGKQTSVTIPNKINGLNVVKIAKNAFAESKIKSVSIPSSCKYIDWFAFYGCYSLNTIYIPSSVQSIGYGAFDGCSKSLTIYCDSKSFAEKYAQSFGISYSQYR